MVEYLSGESHGAKVQFALRNVKDAVLQRRGYSGGSWSDDDGGFVSVTGVWAFVIVPWANDLARATKATTSSGKGSGPVRALNIALRAAHLGSMGVVLGGVVFDVTFETMQPSLWLAAGSGLALAIVEAGFRWTWLHEGRGVVTLAKLALLCVVPFAGGYRLAILFAAVALASVGSHMPRRFRHYSVLYRRVIDDRRDVVGGAPESEG